MGRDRNVKTYGRHHGSRVVTVDKGLWDSSGDQRKHVFSLSSESSIDTSHSQDFTSKTRVSQKNNENKENANRRTTRRIIKRKEYGSAMESSGGSTGSESLFSSHRTRRALRDTSNDQICVIPKGKRKRQPAASKDINTKPIIKKSEFSYNFSEFDDYSLCISGSPQQRTNDKSVPNPNSNTVSLRKSGVIETSTPLAKRTRSYVSFSKDGTGSCADISYIDSVENSPSVNSDTDNLGISCMSSIVDSPVIVQSEKNSNCKQSNKLTSEAESPVNDCQIQLQKLRNSFLLMHISGRRGRKVPIDSTFDHSASLFSNVSDSKLEDENKDDSEEEDDESDNETDDSVDENDDLSDIHEDEEVDEETCPEDESDKSSKSGNTTRYMLNNDDEASEYNTAESMTSDKSYHTAQGDSRQQDVKSPDVLSSPAIFHEKGKTPSTPALCNKRNLKCLNESLIIMLTPVKKGKDEDTEMSPKSKVFEICQQEEPVTFNSCITPVMMKICTKVGEGVYGEVFRTQNNGQSVALKVIPIEGDFEVNDEPQKTFEGMLPEIVISKELSLLRTNKEACTDNFCEVNSVTCVKGKYPRELLKQWDVFHEEKESQNDKPDIFTDKQLFIVFEFADGGKDVESAKFHNIFEAKSVLIQVAYSLAVAEEALQFEHRDLHWGNVLVQKTKKTHLKYKLMGQLYKVECFNVHVSIIDFTLSRLHTEGVTTYNDLSTDDTLFEGTGDYQFDIYRKMKEENGNEWEKFNPKSNVWWLHYLTDKLVRSKRYTRNTKEDQAMFREMRLFLKEIPNYSSACELVTCSEFFLS